MMTRARTALFVFLLACLAAGPVQANCSNPAGVERDIMYNADYHTYQFCNGTNWREMGGYSGISVGSAGTPSAFSFTDLTGQPLSTLVSSNTVTITGFTGSLTASVTGGGSPAISVNGGAWASAATIQSGQTIQVRLTSSASASTQLTATVTIGSGSANWHVTTRAGSLNVFLTTNAYADAGLGGLSGADTICQAEANTAGYSGTYKAILSDDSTSAASRLTLSYPIVNAYDGTTVSASNLWNGVLSAAIKTPSGSAPNAGVATGTKVAGGIDTGYTCTNWSTTSGNGAIGNTSLYSSSGWILQGDSCCFTTACTSVNRLYCIQQ